MGLLCSMLRSHLVDDFVLVVVFCNSWLVYQLRTHLTRFQFRVNIYNNHGATKHLTFL